MTSAAVFNTNDLFGKRLSAYIHFHSEMDWGSCRSFLHHLLVCQADYSCWDFLVSSDEWEKGLLRVLSTNEFQWNVGHSLNVFQNFTEISHTFGRLSMSPDPVELGGKEKALKYSMQDSKSKNVQIDGKYIYVCHCAELNLSYLMNHSYDAAPCLPCCLLGHLHLNLKETARKCTMKISKYTLQKFLIYV